MIQIISHIALHDKQYQIYVFKNKILEKTITVDNFKDFPLEILNAYFAYHADKIILGGNNLLTYQYKKEILKENKRLYHLDDICIETVEDS